MYDEFDGVVNGKIRSDQPHNAGSVLVEMRRDIACVRSVTVCAILKPHYTVACR